MAVGARPGAVSRGEVEAGVLFNNERWPFVARGREVAAVVRTVTGPDPGGAIIVGPAGIGKSRLADEVLTTLAQRGYRCLRVHASEAARDVNLGAFARLLPAAQASGAGGPVASALQTLAAGTGRTVLLVDDVDLLDPVSAVVVHQVVANGLLDVVATIRAGIATPEFVAALARTGRLNRIDLGPLAARDVTEVVTTALGGPVSSITLSYIQRISAGNPLYLRDLLGGGLEIGSLAVVDGLWHLRQSPATAPRLADLLEGRLRSTTQAERRALELLAIAGQLGLSQLHELCDLDAVESLERRGLITVRADGRRTQASLAHPMYGEILRTTLPASARLRYSRSLADAYERTGTRRRDDLIKWGVWRLDGGGEVNRNLMSDAARRAVALRARVGVRQRLARHAWRSGDARAGLLLCSAQFDAGLYAAGYETLDELAASADNDAARAGEALTRAFYLGWGAGRLDEALAHLRKASVAVVDADLRGELTAQRAMLLAASGAPAAALALLEPLPTTPPPASSLRRAAAGAMAKMLAGQFPDALRLARWAYDAVAADAVTTDAVAAEAVATDIAADDIAADDIAADDAAAADAAASDAVDVQLDTGVMAGLAGLCLRVITDAGHAGEARHFGSSALQSAARASDAHGLAWITAGLASLELPAGNLDDARRYALEAAAYFRQVNSPIGLGWVLAIGLMAATHQGDAVGANAIAAELAQTRPEQWQIQLYHYEIDRALAWHAVCDGGSAIACSTLAERARYWLDRGAVMPAVVLCGDLARLGRPDLAREVLTACELPDGWPLGAAIVDFVTATADNDAAALELASARFAQLGFLVYAADAMATAAAAWVAASGDASRAAIRAGGAAAALAARCPDLRTPLLDRIGPAARLTSREREIAVLAAQGLTNRAIAARLTVSSRTVENHLAHAYLKLGLHRRDQLAAWLASTLLGRVSPSE